MRILRKEAYRSTPWKNGGGITQEVIRSPTDGAAFDWRLSVARIEKPGPFSDFSGYARTMVLLAGGGIRLSGAGAADLRLHRCGDLIRFDGALHLHCDLLNGPCTDLNLMVSKRVGEAQIGIEALSRQPVLRAVPGNTLVLFCIAGPAVLDHGKGQTERLHSWDCVVIDPGDGDVRVNRDDDAPEGAVIFIAQIPGRT
jgi:environmental stress-induced protein Ves